MEKRKSPYEELKTAKENTEPNLRYVEEERE